MGNQFYGYLNQMRNIQHEMFISQESKNEPK